MLPWLALMALPFLVHLPALTGWLHFDPVYAYSGVNTGGSWTTNGVLPGNPGWIDGNAGVTTEAMGTLVAHDWLRGIVPWWNPYAGVGLPLAAQQQAAPFFLPFILLLALPHGLLALKIAMLLIAGLSANALLRTMGMLPVAALVGAALFQLNGAFAWQSHTPILPVAFLPMTLLGLEQARLGRFPIWTGLGIAWTLLAGFPETAFFDIGLAALWGAVRLVETDRRLAYAARGIGAACLGAMIAAPSVWPFIEALPRSFVGVHAFATDTWLPHATPALLLFPYLYGNIFAYGLRHGGPVLDVWWSVLGYCDLVLVGLALIGLRTGARDTALRCALFGWVAIMVARAVTFPGLMALFDAVPMLRQTLFILYVVPSWSMALSVLAAFAIDDHARGHAPRLPPRMLVLAALACAALVVAVPHVALLLRKVPGYAAFPILSIVGGCGAMAGVAWLISRPPSPRRSRRLALLVIANATLLFGLPLLAGTHDRQLDTPGLRLLRSRGETIRVVSFGPLVPNYGSMFGIAQINHNYIPVPRNWVDYVRRHFDPAMDGINFYADSVPPAAGLSRLLDAYQRAGVGYVLTAPAEGAMLAGHGAVRIAETSVMDVWALPHPAAYFQADGCVLTPRSRTAVDAVCPAAARLIRRELFWPGWRATLDGRATPIGKVEEIFQAIDLPAGASTARFSYLPPGIALAWLACAIGAAGLGAASLRGTSLRAISMGAASLGAPPPAALPPAP